MNTLLYALALGGMSVSRVPAQDGNLSVRVNGARVSFQAAQPMVWHTRLLVPLKDVVDELGGSTKWNSRTTSLTVRVGDRTARIRIGSQMGDVDGRDLWLNVAPRTVDGTTLVPITFFEDAFGASTSWNYRTGIASIDVATRRNSRTTRIENSDRSDRRNRLETASLTPERRRYRSVILAGAVDDASRFSTDYDRFLVEQDFRRYQADRVGWAEDYQRYHDGLLSDGSRGDFRPSDDFADYLRQRDFERYSENEVPWRTGYQAFLRWRRTLSTLQRTPAFRQYVEDRSVMTKQVEKSPSPADRNAPTP